MTVQIARSKLDDIYSLSNKITCKEFASKIPNYEKLVYELDAGLERYIDRYTGKVRSDISYVRDSCPLCESKDFGYIFTKQGFDHMLCNSCEMIFTLEVLKNEKISHLEEGTEGTSYGEYKEDKTVNELDRKKFEIMFEQMEKYKKIKNIFDIGSQSGTFLDWAKGKYDVIGHEYHNALRSVATRKGHRVLNDKLETIKLDREFDVITCWDYVDHMMDPKAIVKNLSKYLTKDGLFFYAINNADSLSVRILHKDSPLFAGPHHTMNYGIKQLNLLMKDYTLLYAESYVSELNWISNWLNFRHPQWGDAPLMTELFDPKKICEMGMGMKLNAIYQKN